MRYSRYVTRHYVIRNRISAAHTTLLAVLVLLLAACGSSEQPDSAASTIHRGMGDEPESLDVHLVKSVEAGDVLRDIAEGLVGYTPNGELRAAAATRWEISEDGREYTFWLRPNAHWSNGDPVTASDFVFGFRRLVDPATAAFYTESIEAVANAREIIAGELPTDHLGVEAIDEHQLLIRLAEPVPYFLGLLTHPSTFPVHAGSFAEHGSAHARAGNLVSNGAYQLDEWVLGSTISLSRNVYYWNNSATAIDKVIHHVTSESATELNRYRAGELDTTRTIPPESFAQMVEEHPNEVRVSPALGVYYYGFNMQRPPFADNSDLRQALSMAIDRETLVEKVTGRGEAPAYGWVPPGATGYDPQHFSYRNLSREERHQRARLMYREAGFSDDNPATFELRYNTSDTQQRIALAVQGMWRDVLGAEATLVNEEFQVLLANVSEKKVTEMFRLNWNADYTDAHSFLSVLESDNPSNMPGYSNSEYDSLMERAGSQTDSALRIAYLEEAERLMLSDHPLIPLYFYVNKAMVKPRVRGWGDNVLNYHYSQHLSLLPTD